MSRLFLIWPRAGSETIGGPLFSCKKWLKYSNKIYNRSKHAFERYRKKTYIPVGHGSVADQVAKRERASICDWLLRPGKKRGPKCAASRQPIDTAQHEDPGKQKQNTTKYSASIRSIWKTVKYASCSPKQQTRLHQACIVQYPTTTQPLLEALRT